MNYKRIYDSIVLHALQKVNQSTYLERHHIIPKFMGGQNSLENYVYLTPKEHYLCHLLLIKLVPEEKKYAATKAIYMMLAWSYTNENRIKCIAGLSKKIIRFKHPQMSNETKLKLSNATKKQFDNPEKKKKHLEGVKARYSNPLEIKKLSDAQIVRFKLESERVKISESLKRYNKEHGSHNKGRSYSHFSVEERKMMFSRKQKKGAKRSIETSEKMKQAWILRKQKKAQLILEPK